MTAGKALGDQFFLLCAYIMRCISFRLLEKHCALEPRLECHFLSAIITRCRGVFASDSVSLCHASLRHKLELLMCEGFGLSAARDRCKVSSTSDEMSLRSLVLRIKLDMQYAKIPYIQPLSTDAEEFSWQGVATDAEMIDFLYATNGLLSWLRVLSHLEVKVTHTPHAHQSMHAHTHLCMKTSFVCFLI